MPRARPSDSELVKRCLALAETQRAVSSPNPAVGCVIVDVRGQVIAEGVHRGPGTPHAEIDALAKLGGRVRVKGATLYVNLEPCNHHGRTPPCAPVVRDCGVARVVIGAEDPIAAHAGGIAVLRAGGVAVDVGVEREACEAANRAFYTWGRRQRPWLALKAAITLDGKIATVANASKWITGEAARADGRKLRGQHDAILCGIETLLADDPLLTARTGGLRDPIRVIVDSRLRTPAKAAALKPGGPRTIIASTVDGVQKGAEIWKLPATKEGRVDLRALMKRLAREGVTSALCEGGGELHAGLLAARLVDELWVYVAPTVVGGPAKTWVGGAGVASLTKAYHARWDGAPVLLGPDVRLHALLR